LTDQVYYSQLVKENGEIKRFSQGASGKKRENGKRKNGNHQLRKTKFQHFSLNEKGTWRKRNTCSV